MLAISYGISVNALKKYRLTVLGLKNSEKIDSIVFHYISYVRLFSLVRSAVLIAETASHYGGSQVTCYTPCS